MNEITNTVTLDLADFLQMHDDVNDFYQLLDTISDATYGLGYDDEIRFNDSKLDTAFKLIAPEHHRKCVAKLKAKKED